MVIEMTDGDFDSKSKGSMSPSRKIASIVSQFELPAKVQMTPYIQIKKDRELKFTREKEDFVNLIKGPHSVN